MEIERTRYSVYHVKIRDLNKKSKFVKCVFSRYDCDYNSFFYAGCAIKVA